jgi:putative hydrolase of the HAD superfamily
MLRVLSFDIDGTLVSKDFADSIWFEGIPRLCSERWGVSFARALEEVKLAYDEVGPERLEWYDVGYWLKRFGLGNAWAKLREEYGANAKPYPEVTGVLESLRRKYELTVVSAASREFVDLALEKAGLIRYFPRTFSAISNFRLIGKCPELFSKVCQALGIKPQQLLHVGDHAVHDLEAPEKIGAQALLLDRSGSTRGPKVIRSLRELLTKIP